MALNSKLEQKQAMTGDETDWKKGKAFLLAPLMAPFPAKKGHPHFHGAPGPASLFPLPTARPGVRCLG